MNNMIHMKRSSPVFLAPLLPIILFLIFFVSFALAVEIENTPQPEKKAYSAEKEIAAERTIVAQVGDAEITEADLQEAVQRKVQTIYSHGQDLTQKPEYRRDALNDLIEVALLFRAAVKRGMKIPDDVVDGVVEQNKKQLGSEKGLHEVLKSRGLTMDEFRSRILQYRLANELLRDLFEKSKYSDEELKQYYEGHKENFRRPDAVHLYDILLKVEPSATEQEWLKQEERAEEILKQLQAGEAFSDLAAKNSDDPYRVKGGDLGFIHKGMLMSEEQEAAAFALQPGELSKVIRTLEGFYIMKAGEKTPGELLDFDKVKGDLAQKLQKKRFEEQKLDLLMTMRAEYPVKINITLNDKL
ncbi:MAG: peptidylprolyl isomerase [Nitrospirae bacterium]|nr:peptidylprolyl isomerase [Nitrospirota bacterium]